jgi:hypothetical protein
MHGFSYMEMEPLHGFADPRLCYLCYQSSPNEESREEWKRKLEFANEGGNERDFLAVIPLGSIYRKWCRWVLYANTLYILGLF